MNILALEVSTSSAKTAIYSTKKGIVASNNKSFESDIALQDPENIYNTVIECAYRMINVNKYKIDIVGLSSTWHSFLLLDKNRKPISKIRTWADTTSSTTVRKIREKNDINKWTYKKTGCPVHSIYPLWKWKSMIEESKIDPNDNIYISSKPEYIFERLTGEVGVSKSVASGTGLMNIHNLNWDPDILEYANIKKEQLSPLKKFDYTSTLKKSEAKKLGIKHGVPVVITGPDGALNQIGSGALKNKIMTLSVGTSGALRMIADKPLIPEEPSTWCYYVGDGKRLAGAATSGAGNCIEWFRDNIDKNNLSLNKLSKKAKNINKLKAPIFLPFLYGERCPGWLDERKGGFFNLDGKHGIGHLYYSILEGILFNLYQSYEILVSVDEEPNEIKISGGIINSDYWLKMAANIFKRDITISKVKDASIMGAIAICLKITGEIDSIEQFKPDDGIIIHSDKKAEKKYKKRFIEYMKWYDKT